jgi:hypothetical protein
MDSFTAHCVGKVNTGFLTSKKGGLFFLGQNQNPLKIKNIQNIILSLKISHLSKFHSFLGK